MKGRVVVTDAEERASLAACRGLTLAGYQVCSVARYRPAATHWSRTCAERIVLPDPRDDIGMFVDRLEDLLRDGRYEALLPGSEVSLLAVSEHRERLECSTRLGLPSREAVLRSVNKVSLLDAAASVGLPAPPTRTCTDLGDAVVSASELGYPVVLKPTSSFLPANGGFRQRGVVVVADPAALKRAAAMFAPPFLVQRFQSAGFLSCAGVVAEGRLLALTTSRVLRLWPPVAGMHTFSETIRPLRRLTSRVRALLVALEWQGIFQLQLLEHADGSLSVIDLNPRLFASIALDTYAGANPAAIWCDWLLGRDPSPVLAQPARRYRWEEGELCHFAWQLRHGRLRAAASVLRPHRRVTHSWFRVTDPGPLVARGLNLALRSARRSRA